MIGDSAMKRPIEWHESYHARPQTQFVEVSDGTYTHWATVSDLGVTGTPDAKLRRALKRYRESYDENNFAGTFRISGILRSETGAIMAEAYESWESEARP